LALTTQDISMLNRIIRLAEKLITKDNNALANGRNGKPQRAKRSIRKRRTGRELVQFRKMLKAERKKGIPVAEMARKHGISTGYIYLL
jgi:hypothetical protein